MTGANTPNLEKVVVGVYEIKVGKSGPYNRMDFVVQKGEVVTKYALESGKSFPEGFVSALQGMDPALISFDVSKMPEPKPIGAIKARYQSLQQAEQDLLGKLQDGSEGIDVGDAVAAALEKAKQKSKELYRSPAGKTARSVGRLAARFAGKGLKVASEKLAELGEKGKKE